MHEAQLAFIKMYSDAKVFLSRARLHVGMRKRASISVPTAEFVNEGWIYCVESVVLLQHGVMWTLCV